MSETSVTLPELWHFTFSMYPEKARWALDYKKVPHRRQALLPGPHAPYLLARFGQKSMPILRDGATVVKDSVPVIDYLERTYPQPPLYPADPRLRARALELQRRFDEDVGPKLRRAGFHDLLPEGAYLADLWSAGQRPLARRLYAAAFPLLVRPVMRVDMKITAAGAEEGRAKTREALDFVVRESARTGYLAGDSFSVADLTAASVLVMACFCPEYPLELPQPYPPGVDRWLARWRAHPGLEYVRRMYREHRGRSCAVAEPTAD